MDEMYPLVTTEAIIAYTIVYVCFIVLIVSLSRAFSKNVVPLGITWRTGNIYDSDHEDEDENDNDSIETDSITDNDNYRSDHIDSNDADDEYVEEDPDTLALIADKALEEAKEAERIASELQKALEKAEVTATIKAKKAISAINAAEASYLRTRNKGRNHS
jgi:hypothetical protein